MRRICYYDSILFVGMLSFHMLQPDRGEWDAMRSILAGKKELISGGIISLIGYLLSPMSWWNDAFINIPLSWLLASILCLVFPLNFSFMMIFFYWITNFAGIILMHAGIKRSMKTKLTGKDMLIYLVTSLGYTIVLVLLIQIGIIKKIKW